MFLWTLAAWCASGRLHLNRHCPHLVPGLLSVFLPYGLRIVARTKGEAPPRSALLVGFLFAIDPACDGRTSPAVTCRLQQPMRFCVPQPDRPTGSPMLLISGVRALCVNAKATGTPAQFPNASWLPQRFFLERRITASPPPPDLDQARSCLMQMHCAWPRACAYLAPNVCTTHHLFYVPATPPTVGQFTRGAVLPKVFFRTTSAALTRMQQAGRRPPALPPHQNALHRMRCGTVLRRVRHVCPGLRSCCPRVTTHRVRAAIAAVPSQGCNGNTRRCFLLPHLWANVLC